MSTCHAWVNLRSKTFRGQYMEGTSNWRDYPILGNKRNDRPCLI